MRLDHGAVGNGQVLALVGPDTSLDWRRLPRFDSPSIFARILDHDRGGSWAFESLSGFHSQMRYVRNTNVLRTEVTTDDGRFEVFDFAPWIPRGLSVDAPAEVHRLLRPLEGSPRVRVRFDPRPDYARATPVIVPDAQGIEAQGGRLRAAPHQRADAVPGERPPDPDRSAAVLRAERRAPDRVRLVGRRCQRAGADHQGLAGVGAEHRPAAVRQRSGAALGAVPEAARVQRYRRHHCRRHHQHSRADRFGADVGRGTTPSRRRCAGWRRRAAPNSRTSTAGATRRRPRPSPSARLGMPGPGTSARGVDSTGVPHAGSSRRLLTGSSQKFRLGGVGSPPSPSGR